MNQRSGRWCDPLLLGWLGHALAVVLLGFYQQGFREVLDTIFNTPLMWLLHGLRSPAMDATMLAISQGGKGKAIIGGLMLLLAWAWRRRDAAASRLLAAVLLGSALLAGVGKAIVHSARPHLWPSLEAATGSTFPSSHASGSLSLAIAFVLLLPARWRLAGLLLACAYALSVGLSRIYLGVHRPSDVLLTWLCILSWAVWTRRQLVAPGKEGAGD